MREVVRVRKAICIRVLSVRRGRERGYCQQYDMYRNSVYLKDQLRLEMSGARCSFSSTLRIRSVVRRRRVGGEDATDRDRKEGSFRRRAIS